jgi:hypothetical protein
VQDQVQLSTGSSAVDLSQLSPQQKLALLALEALLGHPLRWLNARQAAIVSGSSTGAAAAVVRERVEIHSESEQSSFEAQGQVQTADGRTIQFSTALNLQREYQSYTATTVAAKTTDPLVINFSGGSARLTGAKVSFDLDSDGTPDSISFVGSGSGFLALDANGDGKVNNGSELFGPQTGNGFGELAAYDSDGNGWIDENDPVFSQLRIWTQDGLSTLADKGVGAISVASAETPFALKDGSNHLQGNIRATGVYLGENGPVGTVQQVDLAG